MDDIYKAYFNKEMPEFNEYVDRYCVKHEITPMIACKHALVVEAYLMYLNKPRTKGEEENVCRDCNYSDDRSC